MAKTKTNRKKSAPAPKDTSREPWVDNYPPLKEWLAEREARCLWQETSNPRRYVEGWQVGARVCVIVVYADRFGWEIYTAAGTPYRDEILADADRRLGLRLDFGCKHGVECDLCETERRNAKLDEEGRAR